MSTYADADLPQFYPGMTADAAGTRAVFLAARGNAALARGVFGPLVMRHHDVIELLRDKRLRGPGMDLARLSGIPEGSRAWKRQEQILLFMEGDDHHRLRRLVAKAFTPRSVEALRPVTRRTIAGLVDAVAEQGSCDAVAALCDPFPIPVICALVGVEAERLDDMSRWASSILQSLRLDAGEHLAEIEQAQAELDEHITDLIEQRRKAPRDDLLSNLISVEEQGDRLSPSELLSVVAMMLVAGTDTTRNQLSNVIHTFAEHPDQWSQLRARPDLVAGAVEEAIRWEPATEALPRMALEDLQIGGYLVPAGSVVILMSMSANHDEAALPGADRFDIGRQTPDGWHLLTFGGGIHYCLGANLARLELVEALDELSSRFPTLRLDGEAVLNPPGSPIAGYASLPITWR
ncbi:MAG: cytochrome P450 [Actinomycetota bacterium]|nr:MAG: cytochrome P450 [Acidimicrobiaceae bacterium]